MKISTHDIMAVLRQFKQANDDDSARSIDQVKQSHPSPINQLVQFRFNRQLYFLLLDETAEDRASYILQQIQTAKSDATGELLENLTSPITTYGLPYKGKDVYLFRLTSDKKRLDVLLAERHPETSRSTWQKYIKAGYIQVNDDIVITPRQEVSPTDHVAISLPAVDDFKSHELPVLYLDDDVIVVNKPAGILTHSKGAMSDEFTVAEFFRRYTTVGLDGDRPGIVHRLDRDTSGVIIGARTPEAYNLLTKQFADRKAKKTYLAITHGIPKQPKARVEIPIGRNPSSPSTFRADSKGKAAITDYEVFAQHTSHALVQLYPQTGRTHQLRVHMAYLGTPILGDRVYGSAKSGERLYLHAQQLDITTRIGQAHSFTAPIPDEFVAKFPELS
ncbi:MAG: RluA family pseudouridine synthase [Candidatus Saccharimonas sp.]